MRTHPVVLPSPLLERLRRGKRVSKWWLPRDPDVCDCSACRLWHTEWLPDELRRLARKRLAETA